MWTRLSSKLYSTSSHFILELLQNADDAKYDKKNIGRPTFSLSYMPGFLHTYCNEIGFTIANADAICRFGKSDKRDVSGTTGEKGIGFKSIFGIVKTVHILSRAFSFQLTKVPQGIIVPEWIPFPENELYPHTTMRFELASEIKQDEVGDMIRKFEPRNLLFLRQLEEVIIEAGSGTKKSLLRKEDESSLEDGWFHMSLLDGDERVIRFYKVIVHTVTGLEARYKDNSKPTSVIKMAFEVDQQTHSALPDIHDVYAYLPVKSFGFNVRT